MANLFNQTQQSSFNANFTGSTFKEPSIQEKITSALKKGQWVVSIPYGANNKKTQAGKESQHLLMTQKGPIGWGANGVFGVVRAEGFLVWKPSLKETQDGTTVDLTSGEWEYPTPHRRGEEADEPIKGAKVSGFHKLVLNTWKLKAREVISQYEALGKQEKADSLRKAIKEYSIGDVFAKQFNFSLPLEKYELEEMKVQAWARAQAMGHGKLDKAKMVYNLILAIGFNYSSDGEFSVIVHEVLSKYEPVMTIPNGERSLLGNQEILMAMYLDEEEESKEAIEASLDAQAEILKEKVGGKNKAKKEALSFIKKQAALLELSKEVVEEYIKEKAGRMGLVWGAKNISLSKEEILNWVNTPKGEGETPLPVSPEETIQAGAQASTSQEEEEVDPADIMGEL
jgi:hypothetical protein